MNLKKFKKFNEDKKNYNWGNEHNTNNEIEGSKMAAKQMDQKTPLLDWLRSQGYDLKVESDSNSLGDDIKASGQVGLPYTFYLITNWKEQELAEHVDDEYGGETWTLHGEKIKSLILGKSKNNFDFEFVGDDFEENPDTEIKLIERGITDMDGARWISYIPLNFGTIRGSDDIKEKDLLLEAGLQRARLELGKMMTSLTGSKDYGRFLTEIDREWSDHSSALQLRRGTNASGGEEPIIRYMNLSKNIVTKNEELHKASDTAYMLYKNYKLFSDMNDRHHDMWVPEDLVQGFMDIGGKQTNFS